MRRFQIAASALVAASVALAGCATLATGTKQAVTITSNVDGADVYLDGVKIGTTPFSGSMKKNGTSLRVEKAGYKTGMVTLSKTLVPLFWGNLICGGTVGSITDFASGAAYNYAPATYQVDLKAEGQSFDDFSKKAAVRQFAMVYTNEISQDLARGQGEHLSALCCLLGATDEAKTIAAVRLALQDSRGDQVVFGTRVVDLI